MAVPSGPITMSRPRVGTSSPAPVVPLAQSFAAADALIEASRAAATRTAYRGDWQRFTDWCDANGIAPLHASDEHVAAYVGYLVTVGKKPSTIERALASLNAAYRAAGIDDPPSASTVVRLTMSGARRTVGVAPDRARPLSLAEMKVMVDALPNSLAGTRDRALLLVGFAAALRRNELASLTVGDLEFVHEGLLVHLRRSKTDQQGEGQTVPVAYASDVSYCPIRGSRAWLEDAGLTQGPLWRSITRHGAVGGSLSSRAVHDIVLRAARGAGVDLDRLSAHSLRAGYVTAAALAGAPERAIANVSRHKSIPVLRTYVRQATIWQDAATSIGW